jgi:uncharacterized protein YjbJ (UPF0337 family)
VNKDRLLGAGKRAIGAAKQVVGKLFGDANRQVDGSAEPPEGKFQNTAGGVKDTLQRWVYPTMRAPLLIAAVSTWY